MGDGAGQYQPAVVPPIGAGSTPVPHRDIAEAVKSASRSASSMTRPRAANHACVVTVAMHALAPGPSDPLAHHSSDAGPAEVRGVRGPSWPVLAVARVRTHTTKADPLRGRLGHTRW